MSLHRLLLPFAKRFVAGETVDSALAYGHDLEAANITPLFDLLGEHVDDPAAVNAALDEYLKLLQRLDEESVPGGLSVKPTHLGLKLGEDKCLASLQEIAEAAAELDRFVWIDMESSQHTGETIALYEELLADHDNIGICLQAYLRRTGQDLDRLLDKGGIVRLVKGAYNEPEHVAFQTREAVDAHYRELLATLFQDAEYFAVATHDPDLVSRAQYLAEDHGRDRDAFEFQFLKGVKDDLKRELAADGYTVAEYVPYGPEWLAYFWRRVRERRENLRFAVEVFIRRD